MLLLNQTFRASEKQTALQVAETFGDKMFASYYSTYQKGEEIREPFLTVKQAVPTKDPQWDSDTALGKWQRKHFQACIVEGLRTRAKSLNYIRSEENPSVFLEKLRQALIKQTSLS